MCAAVPLEESEFFADSPTEVLGELQSLAKTSTFDNSETIFKEGDPAKDIFLLKSGSVELIYTLPTRSNTPVRIGVVHPGQLFAWSALTGADGLTAGAVAMEQSEAFIIPANKFRVVMDANPDFGYLVMSRLAKLIASRLQDSRTQLQWLNAY